MAAKVDYDTDKRIIYITLAPVDGLVEIDVQVDLYSDIKEDWGTDPTLNKFSMPISSVGGESLPGSKTLGDTYFLETPWKIRPYEADHKLSINGNLFARDGSSVMVSTIGSYNVLTEMFVSNLSDSSIQQLTEIQYSVYNGGVSYNVDTGVGTTDYPAGTPFEPTGIVANIETIRSAQKLPKQLFLNSDITLTTDAQLNDWKIIGHSHIDVEVTIEAGADVSNVIFETCDIIGVLDGANEFNNCIIRGVSNLNGHIHGGSLIGPITLGGNLNTWIGGAAINVASTIPEINMGGSGQNLVMVKYSGAIKITNLTGANTVNIGLSHGKVILDSTTVTAGVINVNGVGYVVDESGNSISSGTWNGGVTVNIQSLSSEIISTNVRIEMDDNSTELAAIKKKTNMIPGLY